MSFFNPRICLNFIFVLFLLLKLQPVAAQYDFSSLDEVIKQRSKAFGGKVAVSIWKDNKVIYSKEIGEDFKISTREPVTYSGKWFTAAVILSLVDQGKLDLDDKVSQYIPIFTKYAKGFITIRDCLANTTGLEAEADKVQKFVQRKKFASLEEEVNYYAAKKEIQSNPGTDFFYGNIGMNIAARVAEIVAKKSFDRLAQDKVFRPLQMRNTTFANDDNSVNPSTGAITTAADYLKFMAMILNKGTLNGKKILSEEAIAQINMAVNGNLPVKYQPKQVEGLLPAHGVWIQQEGENKTTVIHSPGFYGSWAFLDLSKNYAAVIIIPNQPKEDKRENYLAIKEVIDEVIH
ncbi:MAG TPA: serine hydrolase domain-containing protein [Flavitalea sp.]|nr:serine hydrolase domain-containing protein [Flavitalea sp.]